MQLVEFFSAIANYPFLQRALLAAILCSVAFGLTGPFIVKKRLTFLAGGIAHAVMGGIGVAYSLQTSTTLGAVAAALLFALILTLTKLSSSPQEDTVISTLWAVGMSIGVIFIYLTPGYSADLASFIFGNILMVKTGDLFIILGLDLGIIAATFLFYYHFAYISFDEEFMEIKGNRTKLIYFGLLAMIAVTVVVTIKIVGLILVIALVTLPSVIAGLLTDSMKKVFAIAALVGVLATFFGIFAAYTLNIPASASIILLTAASYYLLLLYKKLVRR